jgi:ABC-type sugar transport system permease subunit
VYAVKLALTDGPSGRFPSLENFRQLADDTLFWRALAGNLVLPLLTVALELAGGLALALLLAARLPARRLLRAVVVVPFALPEIVFLTIMRYVFAPRGYANAALVAAGAGPVGWLLPGRPLTYLTVVAVDAWHTTPVAFLLLLAALAAIPEEIGEAARLDGAGGVRRFVWITLPLLRPALVAVVLLRGLDALRVFATPLVLAGVEGVPVLSTYAYHRWSDYGSDGGAAAAATVLALLSVGLSLPLLRRGATR